MQKYYSLFLIPLLGIIPINNEMKINLKDKNLKNESAVITDIATNVYTSGMIIDSDLNGYGDTLYMWGNNIFGQIPNQEDTKIIYKPKLIDYDWGGNIINLEINYGTTGITIDTDYDGYADTLYMWGNNTYGQIGNGEENTSQVPITKITPLDQDNWNGNIIDLELGQWYSGIIIDTDYDSKGDILYEWGWNLAGQIGNGIYSTDNVLYPTIITPKNKRWNGTIEKLSIGYDTSGVIINNKYTGEDQLYMWGASVFGPYGHGLILYPEEIFPNNYGNYYEQKYWENLIDISFDNKNNGVINDSDNDGYGDEVYLWGDNQHGELANGSEYERITYPDDNKLTINENIISLEANGKNSIILTDSNYDGYRDTIYISGSNDHGQIGNGSDDQNDILSPIKVIPQGQNNWNGNIIDAQIGSDDIMVLLDQDNDGLGDTIYMWGSNANGQLGLGQLYKHVTTPQIVFSTYY